MLLETELRDCLYVNWAVPRALLPPLPADLRYESVADDGGEWSFVSAVLLRQRGLVLGGVPLPGIAVPQCNLRAYVLDADGVPAIYFLRMLLPFWAAPEVRWLLRQPVVAAWIQTPPPLAHQPAGPWRWEVSRQGRLVVTAEPGAPQARRGPDLGSWERTIRFFRERARGYAMLGERLRRIETSHPPAETTPVELRIDEHTLLARLLPAVEEGLWSLPHSAFLCPRVALALEIEAWRRLGVPARVPLPG